MPTRPWTRSCSAWDSTLARVPPWAIQSWRAASQLVGPEKNWKHLEADTVQPEGQVVAGTHWKGLAVPQVTGAQVKREKRPQDRVHLVEPRYQSVSPARPRVILTGESFAGIFTVFARQRTTQGPALLLRAPLPPTEHSTQLSPLAEK